MKKGFTLIELLAVIIVLGIISLIVIPKVNTLLKKQKKNLYQKQVDIIEKAAEGWAIKNTDILPDNGYVYVNLNDLVTSGDLKKGDLINPETEENLTGCIEIFFDEEYDQYIYRFIDSSSNSYSGECGIVDTPITND